MTWNVKNLLIAGLAATSPIAWLVNRGSTASVTKVAEDARPWQPDFIQCKHQPDMPHVPTPNKLANYLRYPEEKIRFIDGHFRDVPKGHNHVVALNSPDNGFTEEQINKAAKHHNLPQTNKVYNKESRKSERHIELQNSAKDFRFVASRAKDGTYKRAFVHFSGKNRVQAAKFIHSLATNGRIAKTYVRMPGPEHPWLQLGQSCEPIEGHPVVMKGRYVAR